MTTTKETTTLETPITEEFDVLIVGAGISGVGGAYHLTQQLPETSFVVLEGQDSFGGTWWSHRYLVSVQTVTFTPLAIGLNHGVDHLLQQQKKFLNTWEK